MTTTTEEKITIPMSERRPLLVKPSAWPRIANAFDHDGDQGIASRANRRWWLGVRQHADGRTAVYGSYSSNYQNSRDLEAGFLLDAEEYSSLASTSDSLLDEWIIRALRRVAGIINCADALVQCCISDLPAEEDEDAPAPDTAAVVAQLLTIQQRAESGEITWPDALMAAYLLDRE